jgi:Ca2+/Na+ antiporter
VVIRSPLPIIRSSIWDLGVPLALLLLTTLRIYKYTLISHNYNERRVCMALFFLTLSWFVILLLQTVRITEIQAKDTILLIFMLTYQDAVRCCVLRMCKMVHIGFEVILFYILLTLFFGIFNRVTFYHMGQADIQDSDKIWSKWGTTDLPRALLSVFVFTPGSSFPDYMVSLFKMNRLAGWIIPIEMFIRGAIMLAIVQSSLYFYYQNFYVKTLATLRADKKLYFVISREFVERGDVPPP